MVNDDDGAPSVASRRQVQAETPSRDERTSGLRLDCGKRRPQIPTVEREKLHDIQLDQKLATTGPDQLHSLWRSRANECSTEPHSGRRGNQHKGRDPGCTWSHVFPL